MDDLVDQIAECVSLSNGLDSSKNHINHVLARSTLFKHKTSKNDQQSRREKLLNLQKEKRQSIIQLLRQNADDDWSVFSTNLCDDMSESMETSNHHQRQRKYKDQLMLSEWMVEVPTDLEEEWLLLPCPEGRRTLVVASQGNTSAYAKNGFCINRFPSVLPGGCRKHKHSGQRSETGNTILDCIYSEIDSTYYVLDVVVWNGHTVLDSETEFRIFWLHSKLGESEAEVKSQLNPYRFVPLPCFGCGKQQLEEAMHMTFPFKVDGLLFYNKRAHYLCGSTPLVLWLKPYMLPEILQVQVPHIYMQSTPPDYKGIETHLALIHSDKSVAQKHQDLYNKSRKKEKCCGSGLDSGSKASPASCESNTAEIDFAWDLTLSSDANSSLGHPQCAALFEADVMCNKESNQALNICNEID